MEVISLLVDDSLVIIKLMAELKNVRFWVFLLATSQSCEEDKVGHLGEGAGAVET